MRDLNFFAAPVAKKEKSRTGIVFSILVILIIGGLIGFVVFMQWQQKIIRDDISQKKAYMVSGEVTGQLSEVTKIKQQQKLLNDYNQAFSLIDQMITSDSRISRADLDKITAVIPAGLTFTTFNLSNTEVLITGTATGSQPVAELLHNLKQTGLFASVNLLSLVQDQVNGTWQSFSLRGVLKDVMPE